jgi:plastocyanin
MRRRGRLVLLVSTVGAGVLALLALFYALTPVVAVRGRVTLHGTPTYTPSTFSLPDGSLQIPDESFLLAKDGSLANVLVYIEDAPAARDGAPGEPMRVVQRNCLFSPRVLGVRAGQPIEFTNEDRMSHNVHCRPAKRNEGFNLGFVPGARDSRTFDNPETPLSLQCDVHAWERAYVGVFDHPYFAVTGPDGTFAFPQKLRPGSYTIVAWHERLGKIEQRVFCFRPQQTILFSFEGSTRGEGEVRPR